MKYMFVFSAVMAGLFAAAYCQDAKDAMEKVQGGIDAGAAILEVMADEKFSETFKKLGKIAGNLGPFLGALGPAISLISLFLPSSPSPEMQLMKKEFAKIDAKFDQVFSQFDEVENLIKETSLKNQYGEYEHIILSLSTKLQRFLSSKVSEAPVFKRSFILEYESSYSSATLRLYNAMVQDDTVLSDNIPLTAMSYTDNHRRRTQNIMKGVLNLILQGVKVELSYQTVKGRELDYNVKKNFWEEKVKKLLNHMQSVDYKVKGKWYSQCEKEIDSKLADKQGESHSAFANEMYDFLTKKYDWRDWHVVTYNPISGGNNHWVKWCGGHHRFRKHGRNVVVASVDKTKRAIDTQRARSKLSSTSIRYCKRGFWGARICKDREAKDVYQNYLASEFRSGCTYASAGVIEKSAKIVHKAPSNRLATVDKNRYKLHVFG